jgi:hypothetical protein
MGAGFRISVLSYLLSLHSVPSTTTIIATRRHLPFAQRLLSWFALRFINLLLLSLTDLRSLIPLWIKKGRRPNLIADGSHLFLSSIPDLIASREYYVWLDGSILSTFHQLFSIISKAVLIVHSAQINLTSSLPPSSLSLSSILPPPPSLSLVTG